MISVAAVALACLACAPAMPATVPAQEPVVSRCEVTVAVPAIGLREELRYYRGSPDDGPGTRIQDRGDLASPQGPHGGVRAGDIGNLFIAGHRTTAGGPLRKLRALRPGDVVRVRTRCAEQPEVVHAYVVTHRARYIDFFTRRGRADQIAPVPFAPGAMPVKPMITLSTCATQEDNARGDRRRDRFGNPPGRWVVTGVLQ